MPTQRQLSLFSLFRFKVALDITWFLIAWLVTWSLAKGLFPYSHPGYPNGTYWLMGLVSAMGLFASILFHEVCHALVARQNGLQVNRITLFLFGGVSELHEEPLSPKSEWRMASVGPLFSFVLGAVLGGIYLLAHKWNWSIPVQVVIMYLAGMNVLLALFNLIPAFPLDGGRILRALLWQWKKDLTWATRVASRAGIVFGLLFAVLGVVAFFSGNFVGGLWWFFIGLLLQGAANRSYEQVLARVTLAKRTVRDLANLRPPTVPPWVTLNTLVYDYFIRLRVRELPVQENERLLGLVTLRSVKAISQRNWNAVTVRDVLTPVSEENSVASTASLADALNLFRGSGNENLIVLGDNQRLVGMIALRDLMDYLVVTTETGCEEVCPAPGKTGSEITSRQSA